MLMYISACIVALRPLHVPADPLPKAPNLLSSGDVLNECLTGLGDTSVLSPVQLTGEDAVHAS